MIRARLGLLGLCAVVFSALTFTAAQAEASWSVLKTEGGALLTEAEIEANKEKLEGQIENGTGSFLFQVLAIKIQLLCTGSQLIDDLMAGSGSLKSGGKAKLSGCVLIKAGTTEKLAGCSPHSAGMAAGTIETNALHGSLGSETLTLLPDNAQEEFINILMGEECAIGELIPVFGRLVYRDCLEEGKALLKHAKVHLFVEYKPSTIMWIISNTTEHRETSFDGSVNISLASGRSWAG